MKLIDKKVLRAFDLWTMLLVFILFGYGLVLIFNATAYPLTDAEVTFVQKLGKLNFYYPTLQSLWFALGLACIAVICVLDYHIYGDFVKIAYVGFVAVLVLLLLVGVASRGTVGWFTFNNGKRGFQPAEMVKLVLIVFVAKYAALSMETHGRVKAIDFLKIGAYVSIPLFLVAIQPDWGTAFVYICIFMGIMFAAKLSYKMILSSMAVLAAGVTVAFFTVMQEYQKNRILGFLGLVEEGAKSDAVNYNVERALQAIGSGGLTGKGFLKPGSFVQLDYLPEKHTDFIFASSMEAVGFIGGVILIGLFALLLLRFLYLASKAKDNFGSFIIIGVVAMEFAHIFENIAMNIGVMPVTGIPLPLISYGGSNMLTNMIAFGLVLNVAMRRPQKKYEVRPLG